MQDNKTHSLHGIVKAVTTCRKSKTVGFTIVELLIVIVVIGILAAITIVAYNGVQQRANNTKTVSAITSWVKAIRLYQVDNGSLPLYTTCLGADYSSGIPGDEGSPYYCRHVTTGVKPVSSFYDAMKPYISSNPTPAFTVAKDGTAWYKGAYTLAGAPNLSVYYVLAGIDTECPDIGGVGAQSRTTYSETNSVMCQFTMKDEQ